MSFSVNTNAGALVALQNLNKTNRSLNVVQNRINTGLKVSGAKDDASIFAIAQTQRAELGGYNAVRSSLDRAKGAIDVALAGAEAVSDLLIELKTLAVRAKDPGTDDVSRGLLDLEFSQVAQQVATIVENAEFNGKNTLQTDDIVAITSPDGSSATAIKITASNIGPQAALLDTLFSLNSSGSATFALTAVEGLQDYLNGEISKIGAGAKRVEILRDFVEKTSDAIEVGIGKLVDADLARESANLQSLQVKLQLGLQALSIANQAPSTVLSLFN